MATSVMMTPLTYASVYEHTADSSMAMEHQGKKLRKMAKFLSLTDTQIEQIKAIRAQSKEQAESLKLSLKAFREQVKSEQTGVTFNEALFNATYIQYQETFAQLALLKAKSKHAMAQILSPEQLEKWQKFMEKRKHKRHAKARG